MSDNKSSQPIFYLSHSPFQVLLEIAALVGLVLSFLILLRSFPTLPPTIPIHFGLSGKPDVWGARQTLWLFPTLNIILYLGITITSQFPHTFNYPVAITQQNALKQYQIAFSLLLWLKLEIIWLFTFIEWKMIQVAIGVSQGLGIAFLPVMLLLVCGTSGFYLWQAYRYR
ncbi:MAG: DUF1648 domain-containing protein [Oscillatoriaceae bacterium SKW80]|nr:DUF1648 domain-containing protein [Oscillatoriaceae bacterium SKYG93]MCX8120299.1 DUF1648 domain-containing protein [Oscillatoriaceae bacterium SKW80]MDW8453224.1 DUF1648 domain-containing protein [Oscillatoriaceae cyanobacterium SKYGB_i_bin93]HIK28865.1 DUF1648 domain-containing protein [Oscillatoriaceae cyanobacterium M7585_C2015_266]